MTLVAPTATYPIRLDRGGGRFLRAMGNGERLFHLLAQQVNAHFCLVVELRGSVEPAALASAFGQVARRHPLLAARIGTNAEGRPVFVRSSTPLNLTFRYQPAADWPAVVASELATPIGERGSALFRGAALVEEKAVTLVLTFHHAAADGRSGALVIADLLSALAGRQLAPAGMPSALEDYVEQMVQPAEPGGTTECRVVINEPTRAAAPRVTPRLIDPELTAALLSASRAHGATLHGALCAALATTGLPRRAPPETTVISPVDLRRAVGAPADACALLVGAVPVRIGPVKSFWAEARAVSQATAGLRAPATHRRFLEEIKATLPAAAGPDEAVALWEGPFAADACVTNLGALPIPHRFGTLDVTALWGPIAWPARPGTPLIAALGHRGSLHLVEAASPGSASLLAPLEAALRSVV